MYPLRKLREFCVSAVNRYLEEVHRRDAENAEEAQRKGQSIHEPDVIELNWVVANNEAERMAKMDGVGSTGTGNTGDGPFRRPHRSPGNILAHSP